MTDDETKRAAKIAWILRNESERDKKRRDCEAAHVERRNVAEAIELQTIEETDGEK